jgi:hypothetical protein
VLFRGTAISLDRGGGLAELGIETTVCLLVAAAIGCAIIRVSSIFLQPAFFATAALAAVLFGVGPALGFNPLLRWPAVAGGAIFNALIPGYLVHALACLLLALVIRLLRQPFWQIAGAAAAAIALAYLVLEVRLLFHGPFIAASLGFGIAELGTDTAIFFAVAIALMIATRLKQARLLALAGTAMTALALVVGGLGLGLFTNPLLSGAVTGGALIARRGVGTPPRTTLAARRPAQSAGERRESSGPSERPAECPKAAAPSGTPPHGFQHRPRPFMTR